VASKAAPAIAEQNVTGDRHALACRRRRASGGRPDVRAAAAAELEHRSAASSAAPVIAKRADGLEEAVARAIAVVARCFEARARPGW